MQTVLVVDDSSFITEGLASILKRNYRTIISSGGEMCLEILKKETPDIIILDILMEPMDGWETLLHIRKNPAIRHIPVIMFSAKKISPFEAETHHPYIDEYITKPVSPRDLLDTIAKVLSRKEASKKILQLWRQAGLPAEEIEEYARLQTSIEVDRGLCSNMQQQLATGRKDAPAEDIRRSVEIIGSRIQECSILAEEIARRGELLVAACGGESAIPVQETADEISLEEADRNGLLYAAGTIPGISDSRIPAVISPNLPTAPLNARTDSPGLTAEHEEQIPYKDTKTREPAVFIAPLKSLEIQDPEADRERENDPGSSSGSGFGLVTSLPAQVPPRQNPPVPMFSESLLEDEPEQQLKKTPDISLPPQEITREPPGHSPEKNTPTEIHREPARIQPQEIRILPLHTENPASAKARDNQMQDTSGRLPAQQTKITSKNRDTGKKGIPETPAPSPGFFSRIIQAILSLFSRSKQ
jgi:CheY-like chemotaxis protein